MQSITLNGEDIAIIQIQIKELQKRLISFPFVFGLVLLLGFLRNNLQMPELIFYFFFIPLFIVGIYIPIKQSFFLRRIIYSVEIINADEINLTTFGTLWRKKKAITTHVKDIKINEIPSSKLLNNKYKLNDVYILGKKYYIFSDLITDSGIVK